MSVAPAGHTGELLSLLLILFAELPTLLIGSKAGIGRCLQRQGVPIAFSDGEVSVRFVDSLRSNTAENSSKGVHQLSDAVDIQQ